MYTIITKKHKDYKNFNTDFINTFKNHGDIILIDGDYEYKYKKFKDYYIKYTYVKNKLDCITYYNYSGKRHREDGPARLEYFENGKIYSKEYYINGEYHREDGPSWICYFSNGEISYKKYFLNGKKHREDGPAYISYWGDGKIWNKNYYLNGKEYSYDDYLGELKCIRQ